MSKPHVNKSASTDLSRGKWIKREPVTDLGRRIISATVEEFSRQGIAGARVGTITRRAGTTDPAFYRYFTGMKQAALFIMSEYYWAPLNVRLQHYRQIASDPQSLFLTVVNTLVQSAQDDRQRPWLSESQVFRIVVANMRNAFLLPQSVAESQYLRFIDGLADIIRSGQKQKIFHSSLKPRLLAELLVATLHQLLLLEGKSHGGNRVAKKEAMSVAAALVGLTVRSL
jgi:AcrR family transcriptional regulator